MILEVICTVTRLIARQLKIDAKQLRFKLRIDEVRGVVEPKSNEFMV